MRVLPAFLRMVRSLRLFRPHLLIPALFPLLPGCAPKGAPPTPVLPPAPVSPIRFASVAERAGIKFALGNRGKSPLTILETGGAGCAFIDFDNDGWPDVLLAGPSKAALFRNMRDGKFKDITAGSGLANRHWQGCASGDYDGDGLTDIFLSGYRCYALYRNMGSGRFRDVTAEAGIGGLEWSMSAAFADFNRDSRLDLFVSQYLEFDTSTNQLCQVGGVRSACGPEVYKSLRGKLFLNAGAGRFKTAPWIDTGKTWGALASDLLDTGTPNLYLANDMMPGDLWVLRGDKWHNAGPSSGTAYDAQGHLQGGMGVDSGDYDNDGRLDLIVTTYFAQAKSLYHNDGNGFFTVTSGPSGVGPPTMPYVAFGVGFRDFDNDGWQDLILTNGHVRDNVQDFDASQTYAQPLQVFRNQNGRFSDVTAGTGDSAAIRAVGRGLAFADYNRDGRVDVLIADLEGPAILLENRSDTGSWLRVSLVDKGANRHGIGARLAVASGRQVLVREIRTSGSVLSAHHPVAHFGLGDAKPPLTLTIRWPDGKTQRQNVPRLNTIVSIRR